MRRFLHITAWPNDPFRASGPKMERLRAMPFSSAPVTGQVSTVAIRSRIEATPNSTKVAKSTGWARLGGTIRKFATLGWNALQQLHQFIAGGFGATVMFAYFPQGKLKSLWLFHSWGFN
jgi:hypothetical protein